MELTFSLEEEMNNAFMRLMPAIKKMIEDAVNNSLGDQLLTIEEAVPILLPI
jgi:hypothetical protein